MISDERLKNTVTYVYLHGKEKAMINFDLSEESLNRYLRLAKSKGLDEKAEVEASKRPNVLIFDIETAPVSAYVWQLWKQDVYIDQVEADWYMLSWSAKWLFEPEVYSAVLTSEEALAEDDGRISRDLWKFIDYADIIIGHNIEKFDVPKMNTRFILHGLQPPSPYQMVDTLKAARKTFLFSSNKLDFLARSFGLEQKMDTGGFDTWKRCMKGDKEALGLMEEYNRKDVLITEEVYVKIRGWIKSHPNLSLYYDDMHTRCPNCGGTELIYDNDHPYTTPMNQYTSVRCANDACGAVGRVRSSMLTSMKRASLLSSTAR